MVALVANTAPVAFGALATPIVTLSSVTSAVSSDSRLTVDGLGSMVGRQTPLLAVIVPLILVFVVDGRRGVRATWLPAIVCGVSFGLAQFVAANYISVPLADIVAALVAAASVVLLLRVWTPGEVLTADQAAAEEDALEERNAEQRSPRRSERRAPQGISTSVTGSTGRGAATGLATGSGGSALGATRPSTAAVTWRRRTRRTW